jgi:hypothetical protein
MLMMLLATDLAISKDCSRLSFISKFFLIDYYEQQEHQKYHLYPCDNHKPLEEATRLHIESHVVPTEQDGCMYV